MISKLPYKTFIKTFELVPRLAVSLVIKNSAGAVLLTKRAIPPLKDCWHLPGSFLLKGEKLEQCVRRVLKNELNVSGKIPYVCLGVFEDLHKDPRGHVVDVAYEIILDNISTPKTEENKEITFFTKLPGRIGFGHTTIISASAKGK